MQKKVLVVGAGIAGLAAGRALARRGTDVEIVERHGAPQTEGMGLYLPANAVRVLDGLGLSGPLSESAQAIAWQQIRDRSGHVLTDYAVDTVWGEVGECLAITRADLHEILLDGVDVRFGTAVRTVDPDGTVSFADGATARYDLVVAADGINSVVRQAVFPRTQPTFLGQVCWRLVTEVTGVAAESPHTWTAMLGSRGRSLLVVPLGGGRAYVYASIDSDTPEEPSGSWRDLFADFGEPAVGVLSGDTPAHFAALHEISGDDWVRDRVVLIGDAAHACSPSMAQGGALALEDAVVLAELLGGVDDAGRIPGLLERYRERRSPRVRFVMAQNHRRDRARNLPALARKLLFRHAGLRMVQANHAKLRGLP
ncbi:FAD-dependent oxidoreductase [Micromonospora sp. NPDC049230]|uniref:FAD-dependent oxidoreductase n=1 Tax=Micromonospora sp. NPDC049230 TaxID=3155502 RepID=UPI0033C80AC1